jgi:hypothetical protein
MRRTVKRNADTDFRVHDRRSSVFGFRHVGQSFFKICHVYLLSRPIGAPPPPRIRLPFTTGGHRRMVSLLGIVMLGVN